MSDRQQAESRATRKVPFYPEHKENTMDVYVSDESLRVYDSPWVAQPPPPRPATTQEAVSRVRENSRKKCRVTSVVLGTVCLLLLVGIICLGLRMRKDNADLRKTINQLQANNTKLIRGSYELWSTLCDEQGNSGKKLEACQKPLRAAAL